MIMGVPKQAVSIIPTKLHRPPVANDYISRKALHDMLDEGSQPPSFGRP
jgi:ATP/maltotriose-dependent transcriptional regulator MalT